MHQLQKIDYLQTGSDISSYIQAVNNIPFLTEEREKALGESLYYKQDLSAAKELIVSHLKFVVHLAKTYQGYGLPLADLIQEGNVGLMKAVKKFNPEKGVRLAAFAVHWIKAEINEYVVRNWRIVKIATTKAQRKLFFNLRSIKKNMAWLTHEQAQEIARDLNVEVSDVKHMDLRLTQPDVAFDVYDDDDDESMAYAPVNYLTDQNSNPADKIDDLNKENTVDTMLYAALKALDERSYLIVKRRWLDEPKATLHELAAEYGISAERVRQLEQQAMKKIKKYLDHV